MSRSLDRAAAPKAAAAAKGLVVAGPAPVAYAEFVRAVAAAAGLRAPAVLPVPAWLLMAASPLTALPGLPRIRPAEIRRLLEDKAFPQAETPALLGRAPLGLEEGLARTFGAGAG